MKYETATREENTHGTGVSERSILEWANKGGWELVAVFESRSQGVGRSFYFKRPVSTGVEELIEEVNHMREEREFPMPNPNTPDRLRRLAQDFLDWSSDPPLQLKTSDMRAIAAQLTEAADAIESLEAALREPDRVARIIRNVAEWTDEARLGLFTALEQRYCRGCGRAQPKEGRCQCQNDE